MANDQLQAVRSRVGSYFDSTLSVKDHCVVNALCLSLAEVRMRAGVTRIAVVANGLNFSVTNDGPALSVDRPVKGVPNVETLMTNLHACHQHPGHSGFEADMCRNGLAVVNAISNSARVITGSGSTAMVQKFSVGNSLGPATEVKAEVNGNRFEFELDKRWSASDDFDLPAIEAKVRSIGVALDGVNLTFSNS